ncbi:MAG: hypothetical protein ACLRWP_07095 [Bilophila wadsworthia]
MPSGNSRKATPAETNPCTSVRSRRGLGCGEAAGQARAAPLTSREVKEWVDAKLNKRVGWVITTAFAKGPVSMKYRGCFQLYSRKQDKKTGQYALNYYAPFGARTLAESFALWKKKYK